MKITHRQRKLVINALIIAAMLFSVLGIHFGLQFFLATSKPYVAVASGSMRPALEFGDLVIIQGVSPTDIHEGDVIVFDPPEGGSHLTIHRVVRIETSDAETLQFITKGDANPSEDLRHVPENLVHGRVIYRIPYVGYVILDPTIPIIFIITIAIVILLWPEKTKRFHRKSKLHRFISTAPVCPQHGNVYH